MSTRRFAVWRGAGAEGIEIPLNPPPAAAKK